MSYFLLVLKLLKLQLDLSLGLQLSYLFSKYFIEWRIRKRSLFYYSTLIRWNISSPVRYWYLSILRENYADIFAPSLLISYCSFSSLILSSIVMINYILSKRFFLKREELSDARVVSITKKEYGFEKIHKVLKVNIWWMTECNLLKFSFVWNLHNNIVCLI